MSPNEPFWLRLKTASVWGFLTGLVFFLVYPASNWWAAQRTRTYALYSAMELQIPFVPQWVWVYLSMYALFMLPPLWLDSAALRRLAQRLMVVTLVAGVCFALLPGHLGFVRSVPAEPVLGAVFRAMFALDGVHNLVPSLHVVYSAVIVLALRRSMGRNGRLCIALWLSAICVSTLLVHQHHVLDVLTGLVLAWIMDRAFRGFKLAPACGA